MRWMLIVATVLSVKPALAAPIFLECKGQNSAYDKGNFSPAEETVSVMLDFAARSVTVGSRAGKWTVPMVNQPDEDIVTLAPGETGVTMGSINRLTAAATFGFSAASGYSIFNGVCRRAPENLF